MYSTVGMVVTFQMIFFVEEVFEIAYQKPVDKIKWIKERQVDVLILMHFE